MSASLEELDAIREALEALTPLDSEGRARAVIYIAGALGVAAPGQTPAAVRVDGSLPIATGSGVNGMSAKQFMAAKKPATAVERITCLAYFLAYGKETAFFKTKDLSEMNREAAGPTFTNISQAAKDAVKAEYLAPAGKGARQLTALGEQVVEALPDHAAVREIVAAGKSRRRRRSSRNTTSSDALDKR